MTTHDPIAEAEVLLSYGRKAQALALLKDAAAANPHRSDIRARLESLSPLHADTGRPPASAALPHLIIAWLFFLFSLLAVWGALVLLGLAIAPYLGRHIPDHSAELTFYAIIALLGIVAVVAVVMAYVAIVLFLHVWFAYLNLLPSRLRRLVDARLPSAIAVRHMEPLYSRMRSRLYKASDDA